MSDDDDSWLTMAMTDDSHVAHLLLRLRQSIPPPPPSNKHASLCLHLHWTVRQPRSRPAAAPHKKADPTRASPTTPLSWSAATSASAAAAAAAVDGHEESSRPIKPVYTSRSKVGDQSETAAAKRSRRKRTLAELKEEENLLLKERRDLKIELAALHLTVEKHRARNEKLKRMKLDLVSQQTFKIAVTSLVSGKAVVDPPQLVEAHCHPSKSLSLSPQTVEDKVLVDESPVCAASASSKQEISKQEASFSLPDLNLPAEKDFNTDVIIPGIS